MDFEIAHINISLSSDEDKETVVKVMQEKAHREADEGVSGCPWEFEEADEKPIVDWHTDSYPFVCVVMLSDCTKMIGGETALRTSTGEIMMVRGPGMVSSKLFVFGNAVVNIQHRAMQWYFKADTSSIKR